MPKNGPNIDSNEEREILSCFAEGLVSRSEVEDLTGLYFSEINLRMNELGIRSGPVDPYEGMTEAQQKLLDEIFSS